MKQLSFYHVAFAFFILIGEPKFSIGATFDISEDIIEEEIPICELFLNASCPIKDCADALFLILQEIYKFGDVYDGNGSKLTCSNLGTGNWAGDLMDHLVGLGVASPCNPFISDWDNFPRKGPGSAPGTWIIKVDKPYGHVMAIIFDGSFWWKCDASYKDRPYGCRKIPNPGVLDDSGWGYGSPKGCWTLKDPNNPAMALDFRGVTFQ